MSKQYGLMGYVSGLLKHGCHCNVPGTRGTRSITLLDVFCAGVRLREYQVSTRLVHPCLCKILLAILVCDAYMYTALGNKAT